ncbi:MAG: hypothetical protein AAB941_02225 [Patescibacteria group bacterium]
MRRTAKIFLKVVVCTPMTLFSVAVLAAVAVVSWQLALEPLFFRFDQIDWARTFVFWLGGPGLLIGVAISMVAMAVAGIAVNGWGLTVVGVTVVDEI